MADTETLSAKEAETGAVSLRSRREGDLGSVAASDLLAAAGRANEARSAGLGLPAAA